MILLDDSKLAFSLVASCLIHAVVVIVVPTAFKNDDSTRRHRELIPVGLLELPPLIKQETPPRQEETRNPVKKPSLAAPKPKLPKSERDELVAKKPPAEQVLPLGGTSPPTEEAVESRQSHTTLPKNAVPQYPTAPAEVGGAEAGAGNLLGKGELGAVPGSAGGGGTASSGLGRDSATTGLPAPTSPVRTGREAKPVQTVRATYPPMALRMGVESDVTLRITIDSKGTVTDAEIVKSGGAGFDDEALKAVKQARFEPAQNDGTNVPAEFTYVYRFRLRR
jgi:TonB family protein